MNRIRTGKIFNIENRLLKGSRKNKFATLGVEVPVWQGAKLQEYRDIPRFRNAARRDASAHKM